MAIQDTYAQFMQNYWVYKGQEEITAYITLFTLHEVAVAFCCRVIIPLKQVEQFPPSCPKSESKRLYKNVVTAALGINCNLIQLSVCMSKFR